MKLEELQRRMSSLQETVTLSIKEREEEIERLKAEIARLEANVKAKQDEEYRLTESYCAELVSYGVPEFDASEKASLGSILDATKARIKSILNEISDLKENISKKSEDIVSLEAMLQEKNKQIEDVSKDNNGLRVLLERERKDKADLETKLQELSQEIERVNNCYEREVEKLRGCILDLEKALADNEVKYLGTRKQVEELTISRDTQRREAVDAAQVAEKLRSFIELVHKPHLLECAMRRPEIAMYKPELVRLGCKLRP